MFRPARLLTCLVFFLAWPAFTNNVFSQTSINEVHIAPREKSIQLPATEAAVASLSGGVHLIRSSAELVLVPVTITDNMNRPVIGLDEDNFQLFENKQPQEIRHFSSEDTPVSIGIIVDTSGSMSNKLDQTREAVREFCEASNPQDEFFMITFSDAPRLATDLTNRPEEIENDLLTLQSKGRTALLDAIYLGIRKLRQARYSRRALLILSDGGDNHSRYSERNVVAAVREADVLVYAVGIYDSYFNTEEESLGPELLRAIAGPTGGKAYSLNTAELPAVTHAIGNQLRHQYMLAYRPQSKQPDGKWHKISVKLRLPKKLHAFLHVTARTGYYAAAEQAANSPHKP